MRTFTTQCCILFRNARAKSEHGHFWRLQKCPKVNRLPLQRLFDYFKNYFSFVICIYLSISTANVVAVKPADAEIFGTKCRFLPFWQKRCSFCPRNLWGYWTNLDQICSMYRKYCHWMILNRNCDNRIRYEMPACWIKVILQILK